MEDFGSVDEVGDILYWDNVQLIYLIFEVILFATNIWGTMDE